MKDFPFSRPPAAARKPSHPLADHARCRRWRHAEIPSARRGGGTSRGVILRALEGHCERLGRGGLSTAVMRSERGLEIVCRERNADVMGTKELYVEHSVVNALKHHDAEGPAWNGVSGNQQFTVNGYQLTHANTALSIIFRKLVVCPDGLNSGHEVVPTLCATDNSWRNLWPHDCAYNLIYHGSPSRNATISDILAGRRHCVSQDSETRWPR